MALVVAQAAKLAAKLVARIEAAINSRREPNQRHPNHLQPNHQPERPDYSAAIVELT